MAESQEELKNLLVKMKGESERVCLKVNIQKTQIRIQGEIPITSWEWATYFPEYLVEIIKEEGCYSASKCGARDKWGREDIAMEIALT